MYRLRRLGLLLGLCGWMLLAASVGLLPADPVRPGEHAADRLELAAALPLAPVGEPFDPADLFADPKAVGSLWYDEGAVPKRARYDRTPGDEDLFPWGRLTGRVAPGPLTARLPKSPGLAG